jgi:serine/threonine protein kinase
MNTLGRYRLIRKLAGGGMAEIHLARLQGASGFEKEVVIKTILPQFSGHPDFVAMLIDEAKIAVRLDHPNIVSVYELAREGETYFIAMEYVSGWDVRRLLQAASLRRTTVPLDAALFLIGEVLEGLTYAHEKKDAQGRPLNIVHRDISPQNVLLSPEGTVKITDFGIAKAASKTHETATGVLKGKLAYMSPEQATLGALAEPDARSDLFSAAGVLYELVTGEKLFQRGSEAATLDVVRRADVSPSPKAWTHLPRPFFEILRKALSLLPGDRYRSAREFKKALMDFAAGCGLDVRREKLAAALEIFLSKKGEDLSDEPTVVETLPTRTVAFPAGEAETLVEVEREAVKEPKPPLRTGRWIAAGIVGFVLTYAATAGVVWLKSGKPPFPPPTSSPETAPALTPVGAAALSATVPVSVATAETLPEAASLTEAPEEKTKEAAKGYLSVRVIPWGTVTVDGAGDRESPVKRLVLAPGKHTVRVRYQPDAAVVSASVTVVSGKEIVCVANFRSGKELKCGK